jgi:holliday junction DNA helicase RuvA
MIASLRGVLLERGPDRIVLECAGVGYEVLVSAATAAGLPAEGAEARLTIHSHAVQDGGIQLFGFSDPRERAAFELLIGVQGVGPKVALQVLSGIAVPELAAAIARGEVARLCTVRGIGKKTAERLVTELRDRVASLAAGAPEPSAPPVAPGGPVERVAQALVGLGYRPAQAERAAQAAVAARPDAPIEALVREALRQTEAVR